MVDYLSDVLRERVKTFGICEEPECDSCHNKILIDKGWYCRREARLVGEV